MNGKMTGDETMLVALAETAEYIEGQLAKGRSPGGVLSTFRKRMYAPWEAVRNTLPPERQFSYTEPRDYLREVLDVRGIADVRWYKDDEEA